MELRHLKTFRAVATLESFNKAAEHLYYAQSTVSEQIKALETDLNVKLFKQTGRKIFLTEAGEALLQYTHRILNLEEELRSEIVSRSETRGSLTVRVPETVGNYCLPGILTDFCSRYPKVGLKFNNCSYFSLEKELLSGLINLAFLITDQFKAPGLVDEKLLDIPLAVAVKPGHPLTSEKNIGYNDLKNEPLLLPTNDCSYVLMLEKLFTEQKVEMSGILRFNSIESIKRTVIKGIGVAILPLMAVKSEFERGLLKEISWPGGLLNANLIMIRQKNKWQPPVLNAFMKSVRDYFTGYSFPNLPKE